MQKCIKKTTLRATVLAALCCAGLSQAATIVVTSRDPANVGFNDPTPVAPVGGNTGTTLGQQRWNVYQYVAHLWEQAIQSDITIQVNAGWEALTCTSSSAVLGSASPWNLWHDFPGGKPGTWYPQALANKLAHTDLSVGQADDGSGYGNVDIKTQFNINLGGTGCLDGISFYLGLDGNAGNKVNFMTTLLHELGHGLGFTVLAVNSSTGLRISADGSAWAVDGLPAIWEQYMYDSNFGKTWLDMNYIERRVSAVSPGALAWSGPQAWAAASMLASTPSIRLSSSAPGYAGYYAYNTAAFGPAVSTGSSLGTLANIAADTTGTGQGCTTFSAADAAAVAGKVAIIDRGVCGFAVKAKNAQNAGAVGVIIANNVAGAPPGLGGTDATVVIPTIAVSQTDGAKLKAAVTASVPYGGRGKVGIATAMLGIDDSKKAGADAAGRPLLYTPSTLAPGSSVSHWDVSASPNLLMEPNINADLTNNLVPPYDLTLPLLKDIGW